MKPALTYWGERIGELRARFPGTMRAFARDLGVSHLAVHKWTASDVEPGLTMAVRISLRTGYTLDHLSGPEALSLSRDFEPRPFAGHSDVRWLDGCIRLVPDALSDRAAIVEVASRTGIPLRTASGWLYNGRDPLLSCARVVADTFGVSLHDLAVADHRGLAKAA